jgi:protease-4
LIVISILVGNFIFNKLIKQPVIGIIKIEGVIDTFDKDKLVETIKNARDNRSIKAVVLDINSPGGEATAIEEIYLTLLDLRKEKPIVAFIDNMGASGAYYIAIASNFIYSKPSSDVGSIGVVSVLPREENITENIVVTGPFKKTGTARKEFVNQINLIQENFLRAVLFQRGENLRLSKEELGEGKIYIGFDAQKLGLINSLGTFEDAVRKAAKLAHISNYNVAKLNKETGITITILLSVNQSILSISTNTVPLNYYLYLNPESR